MLLRARLRMRPSGSQTSLGWSSTSLSSWSGTSRTTCLCGVCASPRPRCVTVSLSSPAAVLYIMHLLPLLQLSGQGPCCAGEEGSE